MDQPENAELKKLYEEFEAAKKRLLDVMHRMPIEAVGEYTFSGPMNERVKFSEMFGDKSELIVIHNMGKKCSYCTLWADELNGLVKHLEDRAAFVLTSPDDPETQAKFARDRGWTFRMYSTQGTTFKKDMGFEPKPGDYQPGISYFRKDPDGSIYHTAKDMFGPGDNYCALWHILDRLPNGVNGWEPKYHYI